MLATPMRALLLLALVRLGETERAEQVLAGLGEHDRDRGEIGVAAERALDLAEPDGALLWFLLHPAPGLLERLARQRTAHAALIARTLDLLAGNRPALPPAEPRPLLEPLSHSEIPVLRYLPAHLSGRRSPASCRFRRAPSRPTCATCTPSSASTAGPRRSSPPVPWACSHHPHAHAESGLGVAGQCSAASPRAASNARPAASQVT